MLIMGEAMHVRGQGMYKKQLYLPLNFVMNLKLLQKSCLNKKYRKLNIQVWFEMAEQKDVCSSPPVRAPKL